MKIKKISLKNFNHTRFPKDQLFDQLGRVFQAGEKYLEMIMNHLKLPVYNAIADYVVLVTITVLKQFLIVIIFLKV